MPRKAGPKTQTLCGQQQAQVTSAKRIPLAMTVPHMQEALSDRCVLDNKLGLSASL